MESRCSFEETIGRTPLIDADLFIEQMAPVQHDPETQKMLSAKLEEDGILPQLLVVARDSLDLDKDGNITKAELEESLKKGLPLKTGAAARYALDNFERIDLANDLLPGGFLADHDNLSVDDIKDWGKSHPVKLGGDYGPEGLRLQIAAAVCDVVEPEKPVAPLAEVISQTGAVLDAIAVVKGRQTYPRYDRYGYYK
ncbi:MAG: hypothetical protein KC777_12605 [Cyanobacteria bacterium HKST-UBA02]|nr:hypothetical protein [Cyanobacteria bacterium HKST-UBA02]